MDLHGTKKDSLIGSPQGGLVSPILANVYLHELDEFREVAKEMRRTPSRMVNDPDYIRMKYLRYADDWVVGICGSQSKTANYPTRLHLQTTYYRLANSHECPAATTRKEAEC
jgi:hypothetical protein